ncbi:MAG: endonuclease III [Candidatus Auribacterota bacterium]
MAHPHAIQNASVISAILADCYPDAQTALTFTTPFQFVVAAQLSAQCTDERVNIVTRPMFEIYRTASDFAAIDELDLRDMIQSCGLYKNKAKNIIACARIIAKEYNNEIPSSRAVLEALPGVGRKTANVILASIHNVPAFAVDTHVFRVTRRLGLSDGKNPLEVELDVTALYPESEWIPLHHRFIFHGRRTCFARTPQCGRCGVSEYCRYFRETASQRS